MRLFRFLRLFILSLWPAGVMAAPTMMGASFDGVPPIAWLVVTALSTLGGITALMYRIKAQIDNPESTALTWGWRLAVTVISQMTCSWLAGAIFFLLGLHFEWPMLLLSAVVAAVSFIGAKAIESVADWAITTKLPGK